MKKVYALIICCFTLAGTLAQSSVVEWQSRFGGINDDRGYSIVLTKDGGYIVAGYTWSADSNVTLNYGQADCLLLKFDSLGILQWKKNLGGSDIDEAFSVIQSKDGGYVVAGVTASTDHDVTSNHGGNDAWLAKTDSVGNLLWQKNYGGSYYDLAYCLIETEDNGYAFAGKSHSDDSDLTAHHGTDAFSDCWVVKTDAVGNVQWQKSFGGTGEDFAGSLAQTFDKGFIVAGYSGSLDGDVSGHYGGYNISDYWVVKLDSAGIIQWQKSLGGEDEDVATAVVQTSDSGYLVGGYSKSNSYDITGNHGYDDFWVVKLSAAGIIQWQKCYGGSASDQANCLIKTSDGNLALAGYSSSTNGDVTGINEGTADLWVIKIDNAGTLLWQKLYGGNDVDVVNCLVESRYGDLCIAATTASTSGNISASRGSWDVLVAKLSTDTAFCSAGFTLSRDTILSHHWFAYTQTAGIQPLSYNWSWGDGNFDTIANPSHTYNTPNYYTICLNITDAVGCVASYCDSSTYIFKTDDALISVTVMNELFSGISENTKESIGFNIMPNPASDWIVIDISKIMPNTRLTIADITGKIIKNITPLTTQSKIAITFPSGAYFVTLSNIHQSVTKKLIVKK